MHLKKLLETKSTCYCIWAEWLSVIWHALIKILQGCRLMGTLCLPAACSSALTLSHKMSFCHCVCVLTNTSAFLTSWWTLEEVSYRYTVTSPAEEFSVSVKRYKRLFEAQVLYKTLRGAFNYSVGPKQWKYYTIYYFGQSAFLDSTVMWMI